MDEQRNIGLVVKYEPGEGDLQRKNTRSLSSAPTEDHAQSSEKSPSSPSYIPSLGALARLSGRGSSPQIKLLAFKALPVRSKSTNADGQETHTMSEKEVVKSICDEIQRTVSGESSRSDLQEKEAGPFIEENDIISLQEAKRSTGYLEQWGHSLKKFVWA